MALAADQTPSDSLIIDIKKESEVIYNWKPKISTSSGMLYFYLTDSIKDQIIYYDGYTAFGYSDYTITIGVDSVINIE